MAKRKRNDNKLRYTDMMLLLSLHTMESARRRFLRNIVDTQPSPTFKPNPPYSTYRNK